MCRCAGGPLRTLPASGLVQVPEYGRPSEHRGEIQARASTLLLAHFVIGPPRRSSEPSWPPQLASPPPGGARPSRQVLISGVRSDFPATRFLDGWILVSAASSQTENLSLRSHFSSSEAFVARSRLFGRVVGSAVSRPDPSGSARGTPAALPPAARACAWAWAAVPPSGPTTVWGCGAGTLPWLTSSPGLVLAGGA